MQRTPPLLALGLLLVASLATGCDRVNTSVSLLDDGARTTSSAHARGADGADGSAGATGATITSNTTTGVDRLPKDWPADLVLPTGSRVAGTAEVTVNGVSRMAVTGTAPLSPTKLRRHFQSTLDGWHLAPDPWADGRTAKWRRDGARVRVRVDQNARGLSTFEATVDA